MSEKKGQEPAFPIPPYKYGEDGALLHRSYSPSDSGMSYRRYLAAHAPHCPEWFQPKVSEERPVCPEFADKTTKCGRFHFVGCKVPDFEVKFHREKIGQWPWAYADMVLESEQGGR